VGDWTAGAAAGGGRPPQQTAGNAGQDTTVRRFPLVERHRHLLRYTWSAIAGSAPPPTTRRWKRWASCGSGCNATARGKARLEHERTRRFRRLRNWRVGIEARISHLKRSFGLRRTRLSGAISYRQYWTGMTRRPSRHGLPVPHRTSRELEHIARAASEFLVEALAVFEMTQRGFAELLSTARSDQEQRRQTD
jgi:hypothetical protein